MKNRLFGVLRRARSVCAPKNAGKRIFAAFLAVFVAVSAFVIPVHAVPAVIPAIGEFFKQLFMAYARDQVAQGIISLSDSSVDLSTKINLEKLSDDLIVFELDDLNETVRLKPAEGLSEDDLELSNFLIEYLDSDLNKKPVGSTRTLRQMIYDESTAPLAPGSTVISTGLYSACKESAYNSLNAYVASKAYSDLYEEHELGAYTIESSLGESFPRYHFDITDPKKTKLSFK
ncbi:MAG: hypothetical protein K2N29_02885, partial [Ruminiclostridium sp.]|nr:hypothetical protein [Ruminiclostridium sp.]